MCKNYSNTKIYAWTLTGRRTNAHYISLIKNISVCSIMVWSHGARLECRTPPQSAAYCSHS